MLSRTFAVLLSGLATLPLPVRGGDPEPATVTVTARKDPVVKKLDKTVYEVANMPRAANGSAQDVLQALPEVTVTADGRIAVKGNPQVTVMVDGKPAAVMSGAGEERAVALQTMSGADIASVEVITSPSAAYDAKGGAILNIVLKRSRKPGARAQLQGSAADHGLWNLGSAGDLTRGRLSMHGSLGLRHDGTQKIRQSALDWVNPQDGQAGQRLQASQVFVRRVVDSAALGLDGSLSDTDTLSLSARYNARRSHPLFDVLNEDRSGAAESVYHRISYGPNQQSDGGAGLAYSHQAPGAALKAMLQHSTTTTLVDKSYRDVFIEPARATAYSRGATSARRRLDQATLDWTRALDTHQWGLGADLQSQADIIGNYQAFADPLTGAELPDPDTTNRYKVVTTLAAAYLTDQLRHGKWEVLLGARAERMALRVRPAAGGARTTHWQAVNPSLNLKYALGDGAALTLGYRRSLQMPDPRDLNPFTTYVDAQNLSRGNPGLTPQRVQAWEIGSDLEGAQLSGSLGAFYRGSRDTVYDARTVSGNVLVTAKENGGQARSAGVNASLDWTPAVALRLGVDGGIYRVSLETPDLSSLVGQDRLSGYVNARATYSAGRDDVSLDAHDQSAGITPLGRYGATSSVNLSWKYKLNKTLSLTVNANDLFDGSRRTYATGTAAFRQAGFDHFVARRLYVGFVKKIE